VTGGGYAVVFTPVLLIKNARIFAYPQGRYIPKVIRQRRTWIQISLNPAPVAPSKKSRPVSRFSTDKTVRVAK
jgi:hypothetical protein